jgi:hypothetical protein
MGGRQACRRERGDCSMGNRAHSDTASGVFRLRKDDPLTTDGIIVDMHDETYATLTTVEVRNGAVMLHCLAAWEGLEENEEAEEEETSDSSGDEEDEDEEDEDEEEDEEEEGDDDEEEEEAAESDEADGHKAKSYTVTSGNSLTVRATAVRLEPLGAETAEGTYRVQMIRSTDY